MIAYCTHCWREVSSEDKVCSGCKADLTLDHRTYEEKLIGAFVRPLPEARERICWLIGEKHIRQAVSDLMRLATNDPDLFVCKAALEGLGACEIKNQHRSCAESAPARTVSLPPPQRRVYAP